MLEILTSSTAVDLSTAEAMRSPDRLPEVSAEVLGPLVTAASRAIAAELGYGGGEVRTLAWQKYRYKGEGRGRRKVFLPVRPVGKVDEVLAEGEAVTDFSLHALSGAVWRACGWPAPEVYAGWLEARRVAAGPKEVNLEVTFWAGWALPGMIGLPAEAPVLDPLLERACWLTVKAWVLKDRRDEQILSRSQSLSVPEQPGYGASLSYAAPTGEMLPPDALALLNEFRPRGAA